MAQQMPVQRVMPTVRVKDENQRKTPSSPERAKRKETGVVISLVLSDDEDVPEQPTKPRDDRRLLDDADDPPSYVPRPVLKSDAKRIPVQRVKPTVRFKDDSQRKTPTSSERDRRRKTGVAKRPVSPHLREARANKTLTLSPILSTVSSDRCSNCGRRQNSRPCPKCGSLPAPTPPTSQSDETLEEIYESEEEPRKSTTKRARISKNLPQCSCQMCDTICQPVGDAFVNVPSCACSRSPGKKTRAPKANCTCGGLPPPKYCIQCGCPLRPTGELCKSSELPKDTKRNDFGEEIGLHTEDSGDRRNITPLTCPLCRECLVSLFPGAHKRSELRGGPSEETEPNYTRLSEVLLTCPPFKKCRFSPPPEAPINKSPCPCEQPERDRVSQPKICIKFGCPEYSDDDIAKVFERIIHEAPLNNSMCLCDRPVYDRDSQPKICEKCGCPIYSDDDVGKLSDRAGNVILEAPTYKSKLHRERPVDDGVSQPKTYRKCHCPIYSDGNTAKVSQRGENLVQEASSYKSKCLCKRPVHEHASPPKICEKCGCPVYSDDDIAKVSEQGGDATKEAAMNNSRCLCKRPVHDLVSQPKICEKCGCPAYSDDAITKVPDQRGNVTEQAATNKSKCICCKNGGVSKPRDCIKCGRTLHSDENNVNPFERGGNVTQGDLNCDAEQGKFIQEQSPVTYPLCKQCATSLVAESAEKKPIRVKRPVCDPLLPQQNCQKCGCLISDRNWSPCSDPLCRQCRMSLSSHTPHQSPAFHEDHQRSYSLSLHQMHPPQFSSPTELYSPNGRYSTAEQDNVCHQRVNHVQNNRLQLPLEYVFSNTKPVPRYRNEPTCQCDKWTGHQLYHNFLSAVNLNDGFVSQPSYRLRSDMESDEFYVRQPPGQSWINEQPSPMESLTRPATFETPGADAEWAYKVACEEDFAERLIWSPMAPASTHERPLESMEWHQRPREDFPVSAEAMETEAFQASECFQGQPPETLGYPCAHCLRGGSCRCRSGQADRRYEDPEPQTTRCRPIRIRRMHFG